ncbi:MAG: hypothetical protein HRF45_05415 [Fimbriimonadia bacterium]|jgi:polynucleotide 5'-hydroxyl-kinase GRC3/NOL9
MDVVLPDAWTAAIETLANSTGPTMLLGAPDTGKTSLCLALLQRWTESGETVALMDCDLGQSEVGPPGSVGLAYATKGVASFQDLDDEQIEFVGVTSPDRNPTQFLVSAALLWSRRRNCDRSVIDTDGHVFGPGARMQKLELARLLKPSQILALQQADEMEPLVCLLERTTAAEVVRLTHSPNAARRSPVFRARRRQAKWARYFRDATQHIVSLDDVCFAGCRLGSGRALDKALADRLGRVLRTEVLHAEALPGALWVVTESPLPDEAEPRAQELFEVSRVFCTLARDYRGLLCGIAGPEGHTLAMGVLMGVDFATRRARLLSTIRATQSIARVTVGLQRIGDDYRDLGTIRVSQV